MSTATSPAATFPAAPAADLHAAFLSLLPRIEAHAQVSCRGVRCPHRKEEFQAEMVALSWLWFVRLVEKGRNPLDFPSALATFAARAVKSGRRLTGQERTNDVLSPVARHRHGFRVEPLPASTRRSFDDVYQALNGQQALDAFEERLRDNTRTPPPEAAAFRIDFPSWLRTRTDRDCRLISDMMQDERTLDLAHKFGLSPARVSQLRREFMEDWNRFCDLDEDRAGATH